MVSLCFSVASDLRIWNTQLAGVPAHINCCSWLRTQSATRHRSKLHITMNFAPSTRNGSIGTLATAPGAAFEIGPLPKSTICYPLCHIDQPDGWNVEGIWSAGRARLVKIGPSSPVYPVNLAGACMCISLIHKFFLNHAVRLLNSSV